ncbi:hypothetical protein [Ensifer adhaerens]|uniref:hypothetical protein n=1 Tax=Ensifer adhaerens TaxID=106592 RepID=UPI0011467A16|nr:hypothetical protein [Ensifer adhaerens]
MEDSFDVQTQWQPASGVPIAWRKMLKNSFGINGGAWTFGHVACGRKTTMMSAAALSAARREAPC